MFAFGWLNVHPQDGPHVDLRIEIGAEAVQLKTIVNLAFADELVEPARENLDTIHPVEQAALADGLFEALASRNRIVVDGTEISPERGRFEVFDPDPALTGLFPVYGARALTQVRIDLEYALTAPPETVTIAWGAFPDDTAERRISSDVPREVLARLSAGGIESVITFVEGEAPFQWSASGAVATDHLLPVPPVALGAAVELPLVSLGLLGIALVCAFAFAVQPRAGQPRRRLFVLFWLILGTFLTRDLARWPVGGPAPPTADAALAAFEPLHANVYRAFDFSDESDVYDALARSVEGELLERMYEEIYTSLVVEEAGGAVGSVQALTPLTTDVRRIDVDGDRPHFDVDARWQVEGAVFHWGHSHWRVQELAASFGVRATDDGWRITACEITEQVLVSATQDQPGEDGPLEIPDEL